MIKKILKSILEILALLLIVIGVLLIHPNIVGFFAKTFTHNTLEISNIDIDFDFNDNKFIISSQHIDITTPSSHYVLTRPKMIFDSIIVNPAITVGNLQGNHQGLKFHTSDLNIIRIDGKKIITGTIKSIDIAQTLPNLSSIPAPKVINYLQHSLKTGSLKNINYQIIKHNDKYSIDIKGKIDNGYIKFSPTWDAVNAIYTDFTIDNNKLILNIKRATIAGIQASGVVEVNWGGELFVGVDVNTQSQTEVVLDFLKHQPLPPKLVSSLDSFVATGGVNAVVKLHLPITNKANKANKHKKPQVIVNAQLIDNAFSTFDNKINATHINAKLNFNTSLTIQGNGNMYDKETVIFLEYDNNLLVNLKNELGNIILSKNNKIWHTNIVGDNIFANIDIDTTLAIPSIIVNNLKLNTKKSPTTTNIIDITPQDVNDFNLIVKNTIINDTKIPDFTTSFVHKSDGLHINNLQFDDIKIGNDHISINGLWVDGLIGFWTQVSGEKLDDLFSSFDIKEKTLGGKFHLDLRGSCQCSPWELSLDKLSGYGKATIEKGVLSEQDANIGRILSLLNINTLTQRLKLDVKDVANKGFSYDNINAEVILQKGGIATIDKFKLSSSASQIKLSGTTDIIHKNYNLNAEIIPAIKDSVPVATALAGGGAAGLGVWLIDKYIFDEKLLSGIIGGVANFEYKISGDWQQPTITKIK